MKYLIITLKYLIIITLYNFIPIFQFNKFLFKQVRSLKNIYSKEIFACTIICSRVFYAFATNKSMHTRVVYFFKFYFMVIAGMVDARWEIICLLNEKIKLLILSGMLLLFTCHRKNCARSYCLVGKKYMYTLLLLTRCFIYFYLLLFCFVTQLFYVPLIFVYCVLFLIGNWYIYGLWVFIYIFTE